MSSAETGSQTQKAKRFEPLEIGEHSSRASGVVFFVLCLIPVLATGLYGGVDTGTWFLISVFVGILALGWLADAWFGKAFLLNRSTLLVPAAGMVAIGLVQLIPIFSTGLPTELLAVQDRQPLSMDPYSTRFFVIRLVVYFVFLAAALTFLNNERRLKRLSILIIGLGSVTAFFGILQWLAKPEGIYGLRETPNAVSFGPFINQHHFAAFTELCCGLALGLLAGGAVKRDKVVLLAVAALIMTVAALLTGSRGGFLSYAGIFAFVLVARLKLGGKKDHDDENERRPVKILTLVGAVVAAVIIIVGVVIFVGGDSSLLRGSGVGQAVASADASNGRIHFWSVAIKIFLDHPILGAGYDAFGVAFTKYDTWNGIFRVEQAHNDYLQTLADAGIVGFICIAGFIYLLFKKGLGVIATTHDAFRSSVAVGALAGCFGILIHSFFDFPMRTPVNAFLFVLLAALATVAVKPTETQRRARR